MPHLPAGKAGITQIKIIFFKNFTHKIFIFNVFPETHSGQAVRSLPDRVIQAGLR